VKLSDWDREREAFVVESNRIERIDTVSAADREAHAGLWSLQRIALGDVVAFVGATTASHHEYAAVLREREGLNIYITGVDFRPPPGGPEIADRLGELLVTLRLADPYRWHVEYESLHPFTDGNGRSGRALWAWAMMRQGRDPFALGFLHRWYYESLDAARARR